MGTASICAWTDPARGDGSSVCGSRVENRTLGLGGSSTADGPALFVPDMWRKSALLGRFLQCATGIVRIEGAFALKQAHSTHIRAVAMLARSAQPGERQVASFRRFRADLGNLTVHGRPLPRMQMLTVQEILDGKRFIPLAW